MPKSILKKTPQLSQEERNRQLALQHANLIQQRKDVELEILGYLEALIDTPSTGTSDPASPSSADRSLIEEALNVFQPSDFDALVQERNINHLCGYPFCPKPNRQQNTSATFRILQNSSRGGNALKVVQTKDLQQWCSDDCGRRALWLKVQLAEEPAWERRDARRRSFMLLDEKAKIGGESVDQALSVSMEGLGFDQDGSLDQAMEDLSLERGDKASSLRPTRGIRVNVREKPIGLGQAAAPNDTDAHESIEGYTPKATKDLLKGLSNDSTNDMLDTI